MPSIELIRDMMTVDQVVAEDISQTLVEGDIIISELDPEVHQVLSVQARVGEVSREVLQDKVKIDGNINLDVLYIAQDEQNSIISTQSQCEFSHTIEQKGIKPKMRLDLDFDIEHVEYSIENSRKINVKAIVDVKSQIVDAQQVEFVKDVEGVDDIQKLDDSIPVQSMKGEGSSQTIIKQDLEIPDNKPPVREVLKNDVRIAEKEASISEGKVTVKGSMVIKTLYIADNEQASLEMLEHEIPFSHFVEIEDALPYMRSSVSVNVDDIYCEVKQNPLGQSTILDTEMIITVYARVMEEQVIDVLSDIYSPSAVLDVDVKKISTRQMISSCCSTAYFKELLNVSASNLYDINAKAVMSDYSIGEGEIAVEGIINSMFLYSEKDSTEPVSCSTIDIPFRHVIQVEDIRPDLDAEVKCRHVNVKYQPFNETQVEASFEFDIDVKAYKKIEKWVVVSVEKSEDILKDKQKYAITVYFTQPGDTLWKIAKKYNTTVDEIKKTNNIENPDHIKPGMKIIIYRALKYKAL